MVIVISVDAIDSTDGDRRRIPNCKFYYWPNPGVQGPDKVRQKRFAKKKRSNIRHLIRICRFTDRFPVDPLDAIEASLWYFSY